MVLSIILLAISVISLTIAILCHLAIPAMVRNKILEQVVVDGEFHPEFADFATNAVEGAARKYNKLWFYNVTSL